MSKLFSDKHEKIRVKSPVIDFHSHILPHMDDGSQSIEMSLKMLDIQQKIGTDIVVATPHFYGFRETISDFLVRREQVWKQLSAERKPHHPQIILGAEVTLFSKLASLEHLDALCIGNTNTLLLEMPFSLWSGLELDIVSTLCLNRGYRVVLAHFERFLPYQRDKHIIDSLLELPLWVQINAGSLCSFTKRTAARNLFRSGKAQLLGSDCHNLNSRPPNLEAGRAILRKKLGPQVLHEMDSCGQWLLSSEYSDLEG